MSFIKTLSLCYHCGQYSMNHKVTKDVSVEWMEQVMRDFGEDKEGANKLIDKTLIEWRRDWNRHINQLCSNCGEKLFSKPMTESEMADYCAYLYGEFIGFMKETGVSLPDRILLRPDYKLGGALCDFDKEKQLFFVAYNPRLHLNTHDIAPIFFHEFMHIADLYDPITERKKSNYLIWMNEYRASQVEMKKRMRFYHINENKYISLKSKIVHDNKTITVQKYYERRMNGLQKDILKELAIYTGLPSVLPIARYVMYYLGEVSVFREKVDRSTYETLANIEKLERDLQQMAVCVDTEPRRSYREIENYVINAQDDLDEETIGTLVQDISIWFCKHIPSKYDIGRKS